MVNAISTARMLGGNQVLGIEVRNERDLEKIVSKGLPTIVITEVMKKIYPEQADKIYQIVPRTTLNRRKKSGSILNVEESQKAERIARVFSFAVEVWKSETKAREFMTKPHPMLEDRTPFEASLGELGARQVEEILGRLMFGICA
jgi:putative toxin-antitoxin system antitoxin component (TIGR02293 family)